MARFYSNENIAFQVVTELRRLGHDVLTSLDAGKANISEPDSAVLAFASTEGRILPTHNRRDFLQLHKQRSVPHPGIVVCTLTLTSPDKRREFMRRLLSRVKRGMR